MAVQERRKTGKEPRARDGALPTQAELQKLLEALRAATSGETGTRIATRKGGLYGEVVDTIVDVMH